MPHPVNSHIYQSRKIRKREERLKPVDLFPVGEILSNICGPTVTYSETLAMGAKESYCLQVDIDKYIRPAFPFYLFNHSCEPNCGINEAAAAGYHTEYKMWRRAMLGLFHPDA